MTVEQGAAAEAPADEAEVEVAEMGAAGARPAGEAVAAKVVFSGRNFPEPGAAEVRSAQQSSESYRRIAYGICAAPPLSARAKQKNGEFGTYTCVTAKSSPSDRKLTLFIGSRTHEPGGSISPMCTVAYSTYRYASVEPSVSYSSDDQELTIKVILKPLCSNGTFPCSTSLVL
jgi:hypothetical protein